MEKYSCEICGKKHQVFKGMESPLPNLIVNIPEEERESRVKKLDEFYIVDRKWFLGNGNIFIDMNDKNVPFFHWQVWVTIPANEFQSNFENLIKGKTVELEGELQSEIPFYPKSAGLKSKILINTTNQAKLFIEVKIDEESKLKEDQSNPITENRVIEIMQMIHHPKRKDKEVFNRPFKERLSKELENIEKNYIKNKKDFAINISTGNVLFQIVSNKILEVNRNIERGYGLHLSFDNSFHESKEILFKFRSKNISKEFEFHNLDDIPTYQLDIGKDEIRLEELVIKIVKDVYEEDIETIELDNFEIIKEG